MSRSRVQPSWRFVVLLVFLFAASATTPRIWQQLARSRQTMIADRGVSVGAPEVAVAIAKQPGDAGAVRSPVTRPAVVNPPVSATAASEQERQAVVQQSQVPAPAEPSTVSLPDAVQPTVSAPPKEEQPERTTLVLLPAAPSLAAASQSEACRPRRWLSRRRPSWVHDSRGGHHFGGTCHARTRNGSRRGEAVPDAGPVPPDEPSTEEETEQQPVEETGIWLEPRSLLDRLDGLAWDCETGQWARDTSRLVRHLGPAITSASGEVNTILDNLDAMATQADALADTLDRQQSPLGSKLRLAQHALARRLDIWQRAVALGGPSLKTESAAVDPREISPCVTKVAEDPATVSPAAVGGSTWSPTGWSGWRRAPRTRKRTAGGRRRVTVLRSGSTAPGPKGRSGRFFVTPAFTSGWSRSFAVCCSARPTWRPRCGTSSCSSGAACSATARRSPTTACAWAIRPSGRLSEARPTDGGPLPQRQRPPGGHGEPAEPPDARPRAAVPVRQRTRLHGASGPRPERDHQQHPGEDDPRPEPAAQCAWWSAGWSPP